MSLHVASNSCLVAGQGNGTLEGVVAFLAAAVRPRRAARFAAVGVVAIHLEVVRLAFVVLAGMCPFDKWTSHDLTLNGKSIAGQEQHRALKSR